MKNKRIEDKRIRNPVSPESSWRRALKDSENFRHSQKFFWAIEITGVSILGAIGGLVGFFKPLVVLILFNSLYILV